ncbi:MAG TPA: phosphohydrolase [Firmicutes bacterium]|jgi:predicted HD superfamily hydrolase involved in NAD metabolism|nr:phosphohydrolase [Bacillota bacterium]HBT16625.1 phosphohydrolase [Bacillota bacterium]
MQFLKEIKMNLENWQKKLATKLSPGRYNHSLGVMDLARKLAHNYQIDEHLPAVAGLLHDVAREIPPQEALSLANFYQLPILEVEQRVPILLHGKIGAEMLKREWEINNAEILEAVNLHVTGAPKMNIISQIILIADFAEPGRSLLCSRIARKLAFVDRFTALNYIFDQKIKYILNSGFLIHPLTIEARNQLIMKSSFLN